jgi:hypothetical protein
MTHVQQIRYGVLHDSLFTQMIPMLRLKADSDYMNAMSSVEVEKKNYTVNQLDALAKQLLQWIVLIKNKIANDNLLLLNT